jgi:hypothetical protein
VLASPPPRSGRRSAAVDIMALTAAIVQPVVSAELGQRPLDEPPVLQLLEPVLNQLTIPGAWGCSFFMRAAISSLAWRLTNDPGRKVMNAASGRRRALWTSHRAPAHSSRGAGIVRRKPQSALPAGIASRTAAAQTRYRRIPRFGRSEVAWFEAEPGRQPSLHPSKAGA